VQYPEDELVLTLGWLASPQEMFLIGKGRLLEDTNYPGMDNQMRISEESKGMR